MPFPSAFASRFWAGWPWISSFLGPCYNIILITTQDQDQDSIIIIIHLHNLQKRVLLFVCC